MTVAASTADVPPGSPTGTSANQVGKGQSLLNGIAAVQTALSAAAANSVNQRALAAQLDLLQIGAVDYFMGSFWVSADQIIASMYPTQCALPKTADKFITAQVAAIAARLVVVNAMVTPTPNPLQYSRVFPVPNSGYPLTTPDVRWYQLNTQLVDYLMTKHYLTAASILSFMTGAQTYPWNGYTSNYTSYQSFDDGSF